MKKIKFLGNVLFWMTLISPMLSFSLASTIGEANIFGVAGIVRYSWIMLFFLPIGILSILMGLKLKENKQNYKKNFVIAVVCLPLLLIFGSYRFIFNSVSYDVDKTSIIEDKINLELPDKIKVATINSDLYDISYVKIIDNESKEVFEQEIENNQLWQNELKSEIRGLLTPEILYELENFDYFVFYNSTSDEYNKNSTNGECEIIFVAYDCDLQRLIILDGYITNIC